MITFGEHTVQRSRASWHTDQELNKRQASMLAADVLATREKLVADLLAVRYGPRTHLRRDIDQRLSLQTDTNGLTWVVWTEPTETQGTALAVYSEPRTHTKGYHLICEWHWAPIDNRRN